MWTLEIEEDFATSMVLNPFLIETFLLMMSSQFNCRLERHFEGCIKFRFSGDVDGVCSIIVKNGIIKPQMGIAAHADLRVSGSFKVRRDIIGGKADCFEMLMNGTIQARGDLSLLHIFFDLTQSSENREMHENYLNNENTFEKVN